MKDLPTTKYEEIDYESLLGSLKEDGMVFVELSRYHAKAYMKFLERGVRIEHPQRFQVPRWRYLLLIVYSILAMPAVALFHTKLVTLDAFRTTAEVRCTFEEQEDGRYVFIFS